MALRQGRHLDFLLSSVKDLSNPTVYAARLDKVCHCISRSAFIYPLLVA
jgi:hypothetical protein